MGPEEEAAARIETGDVRECGLDRRSGRRPATTSTGISDGMAANSDRALGVRSEFQNVLTRPERWMSWRWRKQQESVPNPLVGLRRQGFRPVT